jgi:hypothetical protein
MLLPDSVKPTKTYQLQGLALFRFLFNWLAIILIILGVLNGLVFGIPASIGSFERIFFFATIPLLLVIGLWYNWPMVWKIETSDDGLLFYTLFQKRVVFWNKLTDILNKRWGNLTIYFVYYRNGESIRFPSGMNQQDELLALIKQYIPERLLTVEKESRQDKASLLRQGFFLFWSVAAIAGGIIGLIAVLQKLLSGALSNALWIAHPTVFLVLGVILGLTTVLRAKSVRIGGRGVIVKTWLNELDITWQDIQSIRQLPFGKTIAIKCRLGWFILGEELSRFHELRQLVTENTQLIGRRKEHDKLLG